MCSLDPPNFAFMLQSERHEAALTFPLCTRDCSDIDLWQHRMSLHYGTDILANSSFRSDPQGKADHRLCPAFKETWKISWASSRGRVKEGEKREEAGREGRIWEQGCTKIR